MPCHERANETISWRPVTSLAIRIAASFDSAPVVSSRTFSSGSGSESASGGQVDDRTAEHAAEQVVEGAAAADGGDDVGVGVAEDRAHLAGGEVEDPRPSAVNTKLPAAHSMISRVNPPAPE